MRGVRMREHVLLGNMKSEWSNNSLLCGLLSVPDTCFNTLQTIVIENDTCLDDAASFLKTQHDVDAPSLHGTHTLSLCPAYER